MHDRSVGIKARHMQTVGEYVSDTSQSTPETHGYQILIVSTDKRRIESVLRVILNRSHKPFGLNGFELYRHAILERESPLGQRTVAMIITDKPDDHDAKSENGLSLWEEAIGLYQKQYLQLYEKEIAANYLPSQFTVITMFRNLRGKLLPEQMEAIRQEFELFSKINEITFANAETDEELLQSVEENVVKKVITEHRANTSMKKLAKSRANKIVKAITVTRDASRSI